MTSEVEEAKPFVKWVGGKRQILPALRARVPERFGTYYEPFVGGGALFFDLRPPKAVLNDANERLVATYRAIQASPAAVIESLEGMPDEAEFYKATRARPPELPPIGAEGRAEAEVRMAAWFLYLNRAGFNGLYRVNARGEFNVPYGGRGTPRRLCHPETILAASKALAGVEIRHGDFVAATAEAQAGDFVYFDPPYVPVSTPSSSSPSFTSYTEGGFKDADQVRLRDHARALKSRGVHVLLSNAAAPRVYELYEGFEIDSVAVTRSVNCKADGRARGSATEVVIR